MLHQPVKFLRQWRPRNERKGSMSNQFFLSLRHSPNGTTKPWSSISYRRESPRIEEFWCAIKPLEKWDIWNREREREDRSLYGVGSRSPVSRKRERHRKKLARVEWYAAAIVPRETVPHIIQLYFYWKMKKEGGRRQAGFTWQETFASLTKGLRAHYFMPYLVSWFTSCHGD